MTSSAAVVPNWNGRRWLPGCLASLAAQTRPFDRIVVVDNGSTDGSLELLGREHPDVAVVALGENTGFAYAANRGVEAAGTDAVALVNTDVELDPAWHERMLAALGREPRAAAAACKMVELGDPSRLYDAGDFLRRDGVAEQRGRFERDDGRFDSPGTAFSACAGAALYRRAPLLEAGGFDERYFAYLEDVELGLRLRLAGWDCLYEPALARHAGEGSAAALGASALAWVERNTLLLVARHFPLRWLPYVAYRQLGWAWHAARERRLRGHLRGAAAALPLIPAMLRERRAAQAPVTSIERTVPERPIRRAAGA
ncbi:MAG: glycosyltransferase family 2 protein [Gaiellaceae bacterium]